MACIALHIALWKCAYAQPRIHQDKNDPVCGAKCLYVILRALGEAPDNFRKIVLELGPAPRNGYSLQQLEDCARKHKLYAESVEIGKEELDRLCKSNSVIIHLTDSGGAGSGHYVLCERVSASGVTIFDGDGSAREVSNDMFSAWRGKALVVSKNPIDLTAGESANQMSLGAYALYAGLIILGVFIAIKVGRPKSMFAG